MKKKYFLLVSILILVIGFAALSTSLIINGNAKVSENTDDFSVIFTKVTLDGQNVYANVIDDTKKIITFETNDLKTLSQTSVLNYEVTNNSSNYDAEVTVNCKVKDDATAKYTSIKNELEGNTTIVKAKESLNGTLTVTLNKTATEEVEEEYVCELTFNAVERNELGQEVPEPVSFSEDDWSTIAANVKIGNTSKYNVGDTKEVDLGSFGTHNVRIANKSECTNGETSETACGFVVEFADILTKQEIITSNVGGWKDSALRSYINGTIYESLPNNLQNVITTTKVISSHGSTETSNFETQDKLYLLNVQELWDSISFDTSVGTTRQLDYYKNQGVSTNSYAGAVKKYNGVADYWWLRSASYNNAVTYLFVPDNGTWNYNYSMFNCGISPAFRIE